MKLKNSEWLTTWIATMEGAVNFLTEVIAKEPASTDELREICEKHCDEMGLHCYLGYLQDGLELLQRKKDVCSSTFIGDHISGGIYEYFAMVRTKMPAELDIPYQYPEAKQIKTIHRLTIDSLCFIKNLNIPKRREHEESVKRMTAYFDQSRQKQVTPAKEPEQKQCNNLTDEQVMTLGTRIGEMLALNTKEVLNFSEAVDYLGLSTSQLYKLTASNEIPHSKPSGKIIFFRRSDLEAWAIRTKEDNR